MPPASLSFATPGLAWLPKCATWLKRFCQVVWQVLRAITQQRSSGGGWRTDEGSRHLCGMPKAWANFSMYWQQDLAFEGAGGGGQVLKSGTLARCRIALFGGALSLAVLTTAGGYAFLSSKGGAPKIFATEAAGHATKPKTQSLPSRTDTVRVAVQDRLSRLTSTSERRKREQGTLVEYYSDSEEAPSLG